MTTRTWTMWDTYVDSTRPDRAYPTSSRMRVEAAAALGYLWQDLSAVRGATIVSATLSLWIYERSAASTLRVRDLLSRPTMSTTTWNRRPSAGTTTRSASTPGATPGGTQIDIDVLTFVQAIADGADWYGWQVETDSTGSIWVYSSNGTRSWEITRKPALTIEWADEPDEPEGLAPAEGGITKTASPILRWEFGDHGGDTTLGQVQVQTASSEDGFGAPVWDSGAVVSVAPGLDLATQGVTPYTPVVAGVAVWWRARHADGAGLWSQWSAPTSFVYEAPASWDLLAPTGAVFTDLTPTIIAQMSGGTLARWRMRLGPDGDFRTVLWDTGVQVQDPALGSMVSMEVPASTHLRDDTRYWVRVDGWDDRGRVATPGLNAAYSAWAFATYDDDLGVAPTTSISATAVQGSPYVEVRWERSTAPDEWAIVRDGRLIEKLTPADVIDSDGSYSWIDASAPPLRELVYEARPVENGTSGLSAATATRTAPTGIWLHTSTDAVCLLHRGTRPETLGISLNEDSTVIDLADAQHSVIQTGVRRGWRGPIEGDLVGGPTGLAGHATPQEQKEALLRIRRDPTGARLAAGDFNIPVSVRALDVQTLSDGTFKATFEAIQRGEFDDYGIHR